MRVVYADVETAGALQSEVDKAGLGSELEVRCDPSVPPGIIMAAGVAHSFELVKWCKAGPRVLLNNHYPREVPGP